MSGEQARRGVAGPVVRGVGPDGGAVRLGSGGFAEVAGPGGRHPGHRGEPADRLHGVDGKVATGCGRPGDLSADGFAAGPARRADDSQLFVLRLLDHLCDFRGGRRVLLVAEPGAGEAQQPAVGDATRGGATDTGARRDGAGAGVLVYAGGAGPRRQPGGRLGPRRTAEHPGLVRTLRADGRRGGQRGRLGRWFCPRIPDRRGPRCDAGVWGGARRHRRCGEELQHRRGRAYDRNQQGRVRHSRTRFYRAALRYRADGHQGQRQRSDFRQGHCRGLAGSGLAAGGAGQERRRGGGGRGRRSLWLQPAGGDPEREGADRATGAGAAREGARGRDRLEGHDRSVLRSDGPDL